MELILNRSLQWFVCQLHANELPLHFFFAYVDKIPTGHRSLTGEIRKSLAGCKKLSVVSPTPIENTPCEVTNKKDLKWLAQMGLGTDIEYLYGDEQKPVTAITTTPSSEQNSKNTRSQFARNRMNNSKHFRDGEPAS
ncbi:hypothetical protein AVEN_88131-1 [Araneus ventricosus]|uniref:Uncharacterized protein n=1 Tax=Araneus ventricosus TaxID=182803 RepID=A0A4Y2RW42_ARAVE|nr:hypothetical protein AVEN_88131-1 [Araneus ventricosus]